VALREVAALMLQDGAVLQGLAEAFRKLDTQGTGRVPFQLAVEELRNGDWDLSDSEVRGLELRQEISDCHEAGSRPH
jgi:hypothetical protein